MQVVNQQAEEQYHKSLQMKSEQDNERFQQLANKLIDKNKQHQIFKELMDRKEKQKVLDKQKKESQAYEMQQQLLEDWKEKMKKIEQKHKNVEKKMEQQKREHEKIIELKTEKKKLIEIDKQNNYQREMNKFKFKHQMILEKQQKHNKNMQYIRNQQSIIKAARKELDGELSLHSEKVNKGISRINDILYKSNKQKQLSKTQKEIGLKIMESILSDRIDCDKTMFMD